MTVPDNQHLIEIDLKNIRPTQITAGFLEVEQKRTEWQTLTARERRKLMQSHCFPVVLGAKGEHYVVDHHHLGLALLGESVKRVAAVVLADLSFLDTHVFWRVMEQKGWAHPFDRRGARREFSAVPRRLQDLVDDPYRSLAGFLRTAGGYAKDTAPFAEFLWADYLRPHFSAKQIRASSDTAVREAMGLARSPLARYLPGWSGMTPR